MQDPPRQQYARGGDPAARNPHHGSRHPRAQGQHDCGHQGKPDEDSGADPQQRRPTGITCGHGCSRWRTHAQSRSARRGRQSRPEVAVRPAPQATRGTKDAAGRKSPTGMAANHRRGSRPTMPPAKRTAPIGQASAHAGLPAGPGPAPGQDLRARARSGPILRRPARPGRDQMGFRGAGGCARPASAVLPRTARLVTSPLIGRAPRLRWCTGCWERVAAGRSREVLVHEIGALDRRSWLERYPEARPCPLASSLGQA